MVYSSQDPRCRATASCSPLGKRSVAQYGVQSNLSLLPCSSRHAMDLAIAVDSGHGYRANLPLANCFLPFLSQVKVLKPRWNKQSHLASSASTSGSEENKAVSFCTGHVYLHWSTCTHRACNSASGLVHREGTPAAALVAGSGLPRLPFAGRSEEHLVCRGPLPELFVVASSHLLLHLRRCQCPSRPICGQILDLSFACWWCPGLVSGVGCLCVGCGLCGVGPAKPVCTNDGLHPLDACVAELLLLLPRPLAMA